jgi:hypothetical protein
VTGTVADAGTGVQNIDVSWLIPSSGASDTVETAADGTYSLTLPAGTGRYYILVNADPTSSGRVDDSYLAEFFGEHNSMSYAFQTLAPHTTRASFALNASLQTGGSVVGASATLANAEINLVPVDDSTSTGYTADSSGNFSFTDYTPGTYELYAPAHGIYTTYRSAPFTVSSGQTVTMNPTVREGGVIEGTITGDYDLSGVEVRVTGGNILFDETYEPNESGHYAVSGLSTGTYAVTVGDLDAGNHLFAAQQFSATVTTLGQDVTHDIALADGANISATFGTDINSSYTARLTDSRGNLVDETNRGGGNHDDITFSGLAAGTYTFGITDDPSTGHYSTSVAVVAGQTDNLGMPALTSKPIAVSGTVAGGKSGTIRFDESNANGTIDFLSVSNFGKSGKYNVPSLLPGTYDVSIVSEGREVTQHSISITKSISKNYAIGPKLVPVTGTILLEGAKLQDASLLYKEGSLPKLGITAGTLSGSGHSGTYHLIDGQVSDIQGSFQQNSPFYFAWPKSVATIELIVGHTTDLGTRTVSVLGGS